MLKWIETTGRSEEDAIAAALFQLGMDRDDVSVEVIERAKSGFLGFGGNPAKVRVSYEVPDEEQTAPAAAEETVQEAAASAAEEQEPAPAPQREDANRLLPGDEVLIAAEEPAPVQGDADPGQGVSPISHPRFGCAGADIPTGPSHAV